MRSREIAGTGMLLLVLGAVTTSFYLPSPPAYILPDVEIKGIPLPPPPPPLPYVIPDDFEFLVNYYADLRGLPHWLVARWLAVEMTGDPLNGRWNPRAVSCAGAVGPAQLMPRNIDMATVEGRRFVAAYHRGVPIDPFDPQDAIEAGTGFLADLVRWSQSWKVGVMAYNGGIGHWVDPVRYGDWQDESVYYALKILGESGR